MDQDRLKKLYQRLLDESYDNRLSITEFRALRTHSYDNEKNEWIPDSYSVFINGDYYGDDVLVILVNNGDVIKITINKDNPSEQSSIVFTEELL